MHLHRPTSFMCIVGERLIVALLCFKCDHLFYERSTKYHNQSIPIIRK